MDPDRAHAQCFGDVTGVLPAGTAKTTQCKVPDILAAFDRYRNPTFPHQSTADQFFDEGQFEAYRSLGQHIGEKVLNLDDGSEDSGRSETATSEDKMSFADFKQWFADLAAKYEK